MTAIAFCVFVVLILIALLTRDEEMSSTIKGWLGIMVILSMCVMTYGIATWMWKVMP